MKYFTTIICLLVSIPVFSQGLTLIERRNYTLYDLSCCFKPVGRVELVFLCKDSLSQLKLFDNNLLLVQYRDFDPLTYLHVTQIERDILLNTEITNLEYDILSKSGLGIFLVSYNKLSSFRKLILYKRLENFKFPDEPSLSQ